MAEQIKNKHHRRDREKPEILISQLSLPHSLVNRLDFGPQVGVFPLEDQLLADSEDFGVDFGDELLVEIEEDAEGLGLVLGDEMGEEGLEPEGFGEEDDAVLGREALGDSAVD